MKVIFQQNVFFQHNYVHLNEKLVHMIFVKSHESIFSIVIEMVQSIHIQYMTKYFIVLQLFESFLEYICTLQYILTTSKFSQLYSLII